MKWTSGHMAAVTATTVAGLFAAYLLELPLFAGFSIGLALLLVLLMMQGARWHELGKAMLAGMLHTKEVVWILLLVGVLIPVWTRSGTISFLVEQGLRLLEPDLFLAFSFGFSAVISMILGTSTGTLSAVGIPLMGVAAQLGVPLTWTAGALISGAFVGDRTSPLSSAYRLVGSSTGVHGRELARAVWRPTTWLALAVSVMFYAGLDIYGSGARTVGQALPSLGGAAADASTPLLWLPVVLLVGCMLMRLKIWYAFMSSIAAAFGLGLWLQGGSLLDWLGDVWTGGEAMSAGAMLHGKGLADMVPLVILISMAGAFNGVLEEQGLIERYIRRLMQGANSLGSATLRVMGFGLALGLVSCTQTLPIMMSGRNMLPVWRERFAATELSRIVADSSAVFAAMVPWNMLAILFGTLLGVRVESYIAFAAFLWSLPLLTIAVSWARSRRALRATKNRYTGEAKSG